MPPSPQFSFYTCKRPQGKRTQPRPDLCTPYAGAGAESKARGNCHGKDGYILLGNVVKYGTFTGRSIKAGDTLLTPRIAVWCVKLGRMQLGRVKPVAVLVEKDSFIERRAIINVTRQVQTALVGISILSVIFYIAATLRQRRESDERRHA